MTLSYSARRAVQKRKYALLGGTEMPKLNEQKNVVNDLEHSADDKRPTECGNPQEGSRDER